MKKLYFFVCLSVLFLISGTVSAQVNEILIPEDFEGGTFPAGWTQTSSSPVEVSSTTPCAGDYSARLLINTANPQARIRSAIDTSTVGGNDIQVSFTYKIINQTDGTATPTTFGKLYLEYTTDANAANPVWTTYSAINDPANPNNTPHVPSTSCTVHTATISGTNIPANAHFAWRIRMEWSAGSYYVYIDDFLAVEQVDCIQPIYPELDNITFNSVDVSWTDLNNATEWELEYGPQGFPPGFGFGTVVSTTTNPTTITGLDDGELYDIYIRAVCGPGDESLWEGPLTFQTIAIGTDCDTPLEITALPYHHSDNTQRFGDSYSGSPGNGCLGNNFLEGTEVVYEYTPSTDDYLNVKVSNLVGEDRVGIFIYESCADIGTTCYEGSTTTTGSDIVFDVFVEANQTYYFVLSTGVAGTSTLYDLDIKGFDCATFGAPDGNATYEFFGQALGAFDDTGIGVNPTNDFAHLQWYEDNNGVPGAPITNTAAVQLSHNDVYHVTQILGTCESAYLTVTFTEFDCLGQLAVLSTSSGDEICGEGTTTLSATAATTNLFWYDVETGGEVRGTGNTFETDVINQTTSYWVAEAFIGEGVSNGQANPGPTTAASIATNDAGVIIDNITKDFKLISVQVYSTGAGGATTITLSDVNGSLPDQTMSVSLPSGSLASPTSYVIPLNFELKSGESYRLVKDSGPAMLYSTAANSNFPYPVGSVAEVTGSTSSNNYYYFYNWSIIEEIPLCESPRVEVIATVNEIFDIVPSAASMTVCVNQTADLTVTSTDTDYTYTWTWTDPSGAIQTQTGANIQPQIVETTTFYVTGHNPITGCTSPEESITIHAIGAGEISVTPQFIDVCVGEVVELFAGGEFNNFEGPLNDWTTVNNSSGPANPGDAGWQLVNSPYNPIDGMTSNDNSQFYISISDKVGPGGNVDTQLISPSMNLVGVQNATLTFYHHYDWYPRSSTATNTQAYVEVSEGQGPWTTLQSYTNTTQGTPTQFAKETISLNSYIGAADVRVRFRYTGGWGWWWAIDNVDIIKDYINGQISWTSSNDLYLDQSATVPYTGGHTNRVFFKSDDPGTFNYTVNLDIIGCANPVTNTVTINVNETLPPTGDPNQEYMGGQTLATLDVTGQNLRYYVLENGNYVQYSPNTLIIHGTTYYITQTLNDCESDYLEVTVSLECPEPTDLEARAEVGVTGDHAAVIITWTPPADTRSIQHYAIEIIDTATGDIMFQGTAPSNVDYRIVQGFDFDKEYEVELYAVCDAQIPVYSSTDTVIFNTIGLGVESLDFDKFTYYPNPTNNIVTFSNTLPINAVVVYTVSGQKVMELNNINKTEVVVDFEALPSGIYFSMVKVGDSTQIVRIIRN